MPTPLLFRWEGDCFKPIPRHAKDCDARFVIGEHYALDEIRERSSKSHAQYFAAINDGWLNLPEAIAQQFPSSEHLRKHCLLKAGYFDSRTLVAGSNAEAIRIAAFMRPKDEYAVYTVVGRVVTEYTPKSQSYAAMGRTDFQASKTAVLELIATLIDVTPKQLEKAGADA